MYTAEALLDIHERCHRSLRMLMDHCREMGAEKLDRPLDGFGAKTIRVQLHHVLGAQKYWLSVVEDRMNADHDDADYPTLDSLETFRAEVYAGTEAYLRATPDETLNAAREFLTWGDKRVPLVPARVILRTQTHLFQHLGQITAMCRLLGSPVPPGMDFSLK